MIKPFCFSSSVLFVLLIALSTQFLPQEALGATSAEIRKVGKAFACQCGCNMTVANCNHDTCPSAIPLRERIGKELDVGKSEEAIKSAFAEEFGLKILAAPPARGFHLFVWWLPALAGVLGIALIALILRTWKERSLREDD